MATIEERAIREKAYLIMDWCARKGDNLNDTDFISHCLMDIANQQKEIDEAILKAKIVGAKRQGRVEEKKAREKFIARAKAEVIAKATDQRAIDIESLKKWAKDNSRIPFDYYNDTDGVEADRVISYDKLMTYLKAMEK